MAWWSIDWELSWIFLCVEHQKKHMRNKTIYSLPWIATFWLPMRWFTQNFHPWLCHSRKLLANHHTRDETIIIHDKPYTILYFMASISTSNDFSLRKYHLSKLLLVMSQPAHARRDEKNWYTALATVILWSIHSQDWFWTYAQPMRDIVTK